MKHHRSQSGISAAARGGFTLVELLVSVALVLLIMTLFAQAFGIAAGAIRTQRGIAENDQRARSLQTILLGDLAKGSFRQRRDAVAEAIDPGGATAAEQQLILLQNRANRNSLGIVPLHPDYVNGGNASESTRNVDRDLERGYFYYSEGDPLNDADDVLQFTVDVSQVNPENADPTPLIGRARLIFTPDDASGNPTWPTWQGGAPNQMDQPIWDDGKGFQITPAGGIVTYQPGDTGASRSRYAEISYFIRDGKLYRRVLLIRDPLATVAGPADTGQPHQGDGDPSSNPPMITMAYDDEDGSPPAGSGVSSDFWNDFDSSATFTFNAASGVNVFFSEEASLDNTTAGVTDTTLPPLPPRFMSLGNPRNRFGHNSHGLGDPFGNPGGLQGRPKEHYNPNNPDTFFGRFTHEETSHPDFRFPGFPDYFDAIGGAAAGVAPFAAGALPGIADGNNDGVTDAFANGPREGEDILLGNCHAFDVKLWDDELKAFVDIAHTLSDSVGARGDFHAKQILDTSEPWNPTPGTNFPGRFQAAQQGMARYGSLNGPQNRVFDTWHPAFNFDTIRPGAAGGLQGPADDVPPFRPLWSERDVASFGASVLNGGSGGGPGLPPGPYLTGARPLYYDSSAATNPDGYDAGERVFPRPDPMSPFHNHQSFFYVATPNPAVPFNDGFDMAPADTTGATEPLWPEVSGGDVEDGDILWKAIPNTIGLQAIQISLRFFDPTSGQFRQLTLTHSFVQLDDD